MSVGGRVMTTVIADGSWVRESGLSYDLSDTFPMNTFSAHISWSWLVWLTAKSPWLSWNLQDWSRNQCWLFDLGTFNMQEIFTASGMAEITQGYELNSSLSGL